MKDQGAVDFSKMNNTYVFFINLIIFFQVQFFCEEKSRNEIVLEKNTLNKTNKKRTILPLVFSNVVTQVKMIQKVTKIDQKREKVHLGAETRLLDNRAHKIKSAL